MTLGTDPIRSSDASRELVDAIVGAVDLDRSIEIDRLRSAIEPFGLDDLFASELRLSGVPSTTWQRCEFCSDVVDGFETSQEAA